MTARAPRRARPRVALQSSSSQAENGFQQLRRCSPPCPEHTFFVIGKAVITMCLGVLQQRSAELLQRLYDFVREVV